MRLNGTLHVLISWMLPWGMYPQVALWVVVVVGMCVFCGGGWDARPNGRYRVEWQNTSLTPLESVTQILDIFT